MWYFVVFLSSLAVDLVPFIGPPAWTVMVLLLMKFDLNPWLVLAMGVPGSTLGRFLLSWYIPKFSDRIMKRRKRDELQFVGKKLGQKLWRSWLFVFVYSLLPLSTTALFLATGIAKIKPVQIIPPFFAGKFISDALMVFSGRYAIHNAADIVHGTFSLKGCSALGLGLLIIAALLFVDWRALLQRHRLAFSFNIWK